MSTRSLITANIDNKFLTIYCHFDGYPEGVGKTLSENYTTTEKITALMALGDLSVLADSTDKPEGHTFENKIKGFCVAYGRDRGEKGTEAKETSDLAESVKLDYGQEYHYFWNGTSWLYSDVYEKTPFGCLPSSALGINPC